MEEFRRRTLRLWAGLDLAYAALVAAVALFAVPWKTPAANAAALAYAAAVAASAPGLLAQRRWAYRLAVLTSLLGLGAGVVVVGGLVLSWAYLRAIWGAFGAGASVVSLLFAAIAFQLLGLYPAVRLRALLRREVRLGSARPALAAVLVLLAWPWPAAAVVHAAVALRPVPPLSPDVAGAALRGVRAHWLDPSAGIDPALATVPLGPGPLYLTLWRDGTVRARAVGTGATFGEALARATRDLHDALGGDARNPLPNGSRLKLDRTVAVGPVLARPAFALSVAVDPGLDGLATDPPEHPRAAVLPDDMLAAAVVGSAPLLPALDELRVGVDAHWLRARLGGADIHRFRCESWIDGPEGVQRVHRGQVLATQPPDLRSAAFASGDFILRRLDDQGRFQYRYDPGRDAELPGGGYSVPRHAGTVYALALLAGQPGGARFGQGLGAAAGWLAGQITGPCGPTPDGACVTEGDEARLGSSALAAIAFLEIERRLHDSAYASTARGLVAFVRALQRPDGGFAHVFSRGAGRTVTTAPQAMFASEEAALALALAARVQGDTEARAAGQRALAYLIDRKYDFFLGRFIYGADAWTCMAAEELSGTNASLDRRALGFCRGYAAFLARLQYPDAPSEPWRDFAGHYGVGHVMVPQAPAAAGFTEAVLATLGLARRLGADEAPLRAQARGALTALARDQLTAANAYRAAAPARAAGGIRRSLVEPEVRIDFVQHAAAAFVRAAQLEL